MISRQSGGPVYRQIAAHIRAQITSGQIRPGQPIPSEKTLEQQFQVARGTVRQAIDLLRREGQVVARVGHGNYVRDDAVLEELTPPPGSTVRTRMPTDEERAELDLSDGTPLFEVVDPAGGRHVYAGDQWCLRWPDQR